GPVPRTPTNAPSLFSARPWIIRVWRTVTTTAASVTSNFVTAVSTLGGENRTAAAGFPSLVSKARMQTADSAADVTVESFQLPAGRSAARAAGAAATTRATAASTERSMVGLLGGARVPGTGGILTTGVMKRIRGRRGYRHRPDGIRGRDPVARRGFPSPAADVMMTA